MDDLVEREAQLAELEDALDVVRRRGSGRPVLLAGEAGIGKTTLVRAFCERSRVPVVLWGACDALLTPRPAGPLLDIAADAGLDAAPPPALVAALVEHLRRHGPALVVIEDLHWADEATLDALRLLGRRIASTPALLLATYRDDELDRHHALRLVLGELPKPLRVPLRGLSEEGVRTLGGDAGLYERTGGNPFFVTEVLAAPEDELPMSVRDAVLARVARLDADARALVEAAAIVPLRTELWLLEAMAGSLDALEPCLASGVLRAERDAVAFRHEIARVAVDAELPPHVRVELHRRALAALSARSPDPARLAHHAEGADDPQAVLEHARAAARQAAALGAHREAADLLGRALRHAGALAPAERAALLERRSYECYLTDRIPEAIDARRRALEEYRAIGDRRRQGDAHRWLSRLSWFTGDNAAALAEASRAVELLERDRASSELAMAYSNLAQLKMLAFDDVEAIEWGERAIALAEQLHNDEILAHALNNVGASELRLTGRAERLERSLAIAHEAGLEEHVARAYTNLGSVGVEVRNHDLAERHLDAGLAYCEEHDLDSWTLYMTGMRARLRLHQGRFAAAAEDAGFVLVRPGASAPSRISPLVVLGVVRSRRGDPEAWAALDEALELARRTAELQRLAPVAAARAEAHWLAGATDRIDAETAEALALAEERADPWTTGELLRWRRRAGLEIPQTARVAKPFRRELAGDHAGAARLWQQLGCPYDAALALADAGDEASLREALEALQAMEAGATAQRVSRSLRELGARDVPRGPRAATRDNPAGLTARELEVLELIAEGLRNADIAARLHLSEKTVDHHVSAILRKLDARSRAEAAAAAVRLGVSPAPSG